ncbi:CHAT domain-containing protein [Actinomadura litoris]|uniref:CHAT domain-containing protein n=1 Tax=Actinomadura litoris TaxID=2678616 RepID=UPI001FA70FB0|nr:CHAT domain-containing tetratricopeptide repeat protein [Actinomadura litoris]
MSSPLELDASDPLNNAVAYAQIGKRLMDDHRELEAIGCYEEAVPWAERALAEREEDRAELLPFLQYLHDVLGNLMLRQSRLDEAETHFGRALDIATGIDAGSADVAKFTSNLGSVHKPRGELREALALFRKAAEIVSALTPVPDAYPSYLSNAGTVHLALGELDEALALFRRALEVDRKTDPGAAATDLSLIGSVLVEYGDLDAARTHYELALAMQRELDPRSRATARELVNVGYVLRLGGDLDQALRYYYGALDIDEALAPGSTEAATDLANIAAIHRRRGEDGRALDAVERAVEISRRVVPRSPSLASRLSTLGGLRLRAGDRAAALAAFREALDIDRAAAPRSLETARDLGNLGGFLIDEDLPAARRHCEEALSIYAESVPDSPSAAVVHGNLAVIARAEGDLDQALAAARRALDITRRASPASESTMIDLVNLGVIHEGRDELDAALDRYAEAVEIVESLRARAGIGTARESLFAEHQTPFTGLVALLVHRGGPGDHDRAFHVSERARTRALMDLLSERRLEIRAEDPAQEALLAEEQDLRTRLAVLHEQSPGQSEYRRVEERLERVTIRIRDELPGYAALKEPEPLDLPATQRLLDGGTLLLAYHLAPYGCAVWAITRGTSRAVHIRGGEDRIKEPLDRALARYREGALGDEATEAARRELADLLLGPVAPELDAARRVVIVPGGALAYLPFEMLPFRDGPLGDRAVVSYVPSATVLGELAGRTRRPAGGPFLGVGLEESLPGTREVAEIAAEYGAAARALLGPDATKEHFAREAGGHRIVHLATHGAIDDHEPLYSALSFTGGATLRVYEMFGLDLTADVVVCSACDTAVGPITRGEGLVGMSRALFYAGAQSLVVSLWPIPDRPTRRLMRAFHRHLRSGARPADALRSAKTEVRASHPLVYRDPYTWAGFVLLGVP